MTLHPAGPGYAAYFMFHVADEDVALRSSLFTTILSAIDLVALVAINISVAVFLLRQRKLLIRSDNLTTDTRDTEAKLYALTCVMSLFLAIAFGTQVTETVSYVNWTLVLAGILYVQRFDKHIWPGYPHYGGDICR